MTPLERFEAALREHGSRSNGRGAWTCPAHADREPSLSVGEGSDGRVLLHCFAGCAPDAIAKAVGLELVQLFPFQKELCSTPPNLTAQVPSGLTLPAYAAAKRLPEDFLAGLGLRDQTYQGVPRLVIPYMLEDGSEGPVRLRVRLEKAAEGDGRFRWRAGSKPVPYGIWRLNQARETGFVVLVEGESDCHTLWKYGIPALGLPGAATWKDEWARYLEGIPAVYVSVEPDQGGATLQRRLTESPLRDRLHLLDFSPAKDPSELHIADPDGFPAKWEAVVEKAVPASAADALERRARAAQASASCLSLATQPRILDCLVDSLKRRGVASEDRIAKVVYLAATSRLLKRPIALAVKGPSSAGKSYVVECVLSHFPPSAYYPLTAMSEHALAYSDESLVHRVLVIYEAAGMAGETASYLLRSLLSEGHIRYETVEKTADGMKARLIDRPGPTGLIVTTTAAHLHPENETRMLSVVSDDTPEQTARVMATLAIRAGYEADGEAHELELAEWHALQEWIALNDARVVIPFASALARAVPPAAVRFRRDFSLLLNLIRAHALLHQKTRARNESGAVVATIDDYAAVRELVVDLFGEAVQKSVSKSVRETVEAVRALLAAGDESVSIGELAQRLRLDRSAAARRARTAIDEGYLSNLETKRGQPAKYAIGRESLPETQEILPKPEVIGLAGQLGSEDGRGKEEHVEADRAEASSVAPLREPLGAPDESAATEGWTARI